MNKTQLNAVIAVSQVAGIGIGVAGGYFLAKRRFDATVEGRISKEVEATKKHYSLLLMQAKEQKPSLEELRSKAAVREETPEPEAEVDEESTPEQVAREKDGKAALINYQGAYTKPAADAPGEEVGEATISNIFADRPRSKKQPMPPRDDHGKFIPRQAQPVDADEPEQIEPEDFLANPFDYEQENLRYFVAEDTLLDYANEVIENERVGTANLKAFVATDPGAGDIICVRNNVLRVDYEIMYTTEDLTEYLGLSES